MKNTREFGKKTTCYTKLPIASKFMFDDALFNLEWLKLSDPTAWRIYYYAEESSLWRAYHLTKSIYADGRWQFSTKQLFMTGIMRWIPVRRFMS